MNSSDTPSASSFRQDFHDLGILLRGQSRPTLLILGLMLADAFFDSLSLGMIVPLLASLAGHGTTGFPAADAVLSSMAADRRVLVTVGAIFALFSIKNSVRYLAARTQSVFLWKLRSLWWESILATYLRSPYRMFTGTEQGKLISELVNEPSYCVKGCINLLKLISAVLLSSAYYCVMLVFSWKATLALTVVGGLLWWTLRSWINARAERLGRVRKATYHRVTHLASESIQGILQIKLYELETAMRSRFSATVRDLDRSIADFETLRNLPAPLLETALVTMLVTALGFLGQSAGGAAPSLPVLGGLVLLAQRLFGQVSVLAGGSAEWVATVPAMRRTAELVSGGMPLEALGGKEPFTGLDDGIVFRDVRFAYEGKAPCLRGVSFSIEAGCVSVLDGASGSGKSTVVGLLSGIHDGYEGEILVDGVELRRLDLRAWRRRLAYLSQDNFLFTGTVRENILLGRPDASADAVSEASGRAGLSELLATLPGGLDTLIGDRGLELSGGQRQRVVLARALVRDPDVLILDEATNAVDRQTELEIQRLVLAWCRERRRTAVIISHSPIWAERADKVHRLEDGRVGGRETQREAA